MSGCCPPPVLMGSTNRDAGHPASMPIVAGHDRAAHTFDVQGNNVRSGACEAVRRRRDRRRRLQPRTCRSLRLGMGRKSGAGTSPQPPAPKIEGLAAEAQRPLRAKGGHTDRWSNPSHPDPLKSALWSADVFSALAIEIEVELADFLALGAEYRHEAGFEGAGVDRSSQLAEGVGRTVSDVTGRPAAIRVDLQSFITISADVKPAI